MKVENIKLKSANGTYIELSLEEARNLHKELSNLFGNTYNYNNYPILIDRKDPYTWPRQNLTWVDDTIISSVYDNMSLEYYGK
jgi:hypothetical protein